MRPLLLLLVLCAVAARAAEPDDDLGRALETTSVPPAAGQPASSDCPRGMIAIEGFCIDKYEAPNQPGQKPFTFVTASEAERWCHDDGKRLCAKTEWERACRGPKHWRFPYGERYKQGVCNDAKLWKVVSWEKLGRYPKDPGDSLDLATRALKNPDSPGLREAMRLDQSDESGKTRITTVNPDGRTVGCESAEGVVDLVGNVTEFVAEGRGRYGRKGCYWSKCQFSTEPDCLYDNSAHPGDFRSYEAGFRCCADRSNR